MLVHAAEVSSLLPSPLVLAALGLLAGALLGGAIAILVGARRGTLRSAAELHRLYPNAAVVDPLDLESVINLELENTSTVYVAGVNQSSDEVAAVADAVRTQFAAAGSRAGVVDRTAGMSGSPIAATR